jgi:hypothetical protein
MEPAFTRMTRLAEHACAVRACALLQRGDLSKAILAVLVLRGTRVGDEFVAWRTRVVLS